MHRRTMLRLEIEASTIPGACTFSVAAKGIFILPIICVVCGVHVHGLLFQKEERK